MQVNTFKLGVPFTLLLMVQARMKVLRGATSAHFCPWSCRKKFLRSPIRSVRNLSFLILDEDSFESSMTSIISCNWFKIMMSHSLFKRHFLLHIIRFKGAQNYQKWNKDHTFHHVANF